MKKLNDYLKDDYGLKKIELSKIKKVENNKQKRFKKSIILIILISILIAIYISINKGDELTIPSAQEIKNESKPSSTTIDTLKIDSQIVEKK